MRYSVNDGAAGLFSIGIHREWTMPDENDPWIDKDFESAVRDTAYFLWENDGRPLGREKDYWFTALDRCLRQREADALLRQEPPREDPEHGGNDMAQGADKNSDT